MTQIVMKNGLKEVEIFGDADKVNGKVGSEYPCWYFDQQSQEIKEEIRRTEFKLKEGLVPEKGKPAALAELRTMKEKMEKIEKSRPDLSDKDRDDIKKLSDDLGEKIRDAKFSREDEAKGFVDPAQEVERMMNPCIKLDENQMIMAKKINCRISRNGEVNRTDAERIWKITRRMNGDNTNTEILRR